MSITAINKFRNKFSFSAGFSMLELILVVAIFSFTVISAVGLIIQGMRATRLANERAVAGHYAMEGIEAVKSIKNRGYYNLLSGTTGPGVVNTGGVWDFSASTNTFGKYTRSIKLLGVQRDVSGNIVDTGGTFDRDTVEVVSTVTWSFGPGRNESITKTSYISNWKGMRGGVLVYGDGGTTTDAIKYKVYDPLTGTWSAAAATADVDSTSTNRALRAVKIYASNTRNEKVMISRHYNGSTQYIYAQVYNGTTNTWGNVVLLASWSATTFLDVQNFGGTYLSTGDFMAVYSNNTRTPMFRVWNGTTWNTATSMRSLATGGIPTYVVARARPGTDEVMAAFFTQASDVQTEYFQGGTYITNNWLNAVTHGSNAPLTTKKYVDFDWSPNDDTKGGLVYVNSTTEKSIRAKIYTWTGKGQGTWSAEVATTAQTNNVGALSLNANKGINGFVTCNKDAGATPRIYCYKLTYTPTFVTPTNNNIATATDTGIQRSFQMDYEANSSSPGMVLYSDNTATPKYKEYNANTETFDAAATSITTTPYTLGVVKTARIVPLTTSDDVLFMMSDANLDLYTVMWNGKTDALYTTPSGKAFSQHGTAGSNAADYWYDFVWDNY